MNKLFSYFQDMAAKAKTTVNSEEALAIRNKLIKIGIILLSVGGVGVFVSFISFGLIGFNSVKNFGDGFGMIFIPFFLIIPFGICAGLGIMSLYCGVGIKVAELTVNFVDNNKYCPHCGDVVKEGEKYCDHCGKPLLVNKICKKCNTENNLKASYCMNCGSKLE